MPETIKPELQDTDEGGPKLSFWDHFQELRKVLMRCALVVFIALILCLLLVDKLALLLEYPASRMDLVDKPKASVTLMMGNTKIGPYPVTEETLAGLPKGQTPHMVFRMGMKEVNGEQVATFTLDPKADPGKMSIKLRNLNPAEGFTVAFTIAIYAAIVVSAPFWMYFIGGFIMPALRQKEKKFLYTWLGWGLVLFMAGVLSTYFYLLPLALRASVEYSNMLGFDANEWRADEYISFSCKFLLGMGIGFQFPIVVLTLVKMHILTYKILSKYRRHFIVVAFILGAVLTTPEVITQVAMAVPMCLLYEICVWVAWYWERRDRKAAEAAPKG